MYQITFSKKALKSIKKFPNDYQLKIRVAAEKLNVDPFTLDIRKLESSYTATHRLRVGDYRLFLDIDTTLKTVIIVDVERRTTQTYH